MGDWQQKGDWAGGSGVGGGGWGSRGGGGGEGREGVERGFLGEGWSWVRRRDNILWPGNRGTRGIEVFEQIR